MATQAKHPRKLEGGPLDGETVNLSGDASSTVDFCMKGHCGRYAGGGASRSLHWQEWKRVERKAPDKRTVMFLRKVLGR